MQSNKQGTSVVSATVDTAEQWDDKLSSMHCTWSHVLRSVCHA